MTGFPTLVPALLLTLAWLLIAPIFMDVLRAGLNIWRAHVSR